MSEYACSMCQQTFEKGWSDEEAEKEKLELFGDVPNSECDVVCDDCFKLIKPVSYKEIRAKVRKDMADVYRGIRKKNTAIARFYYLMNKQMEKQMVDVILYGAVK